MEKIWLKNYPKGVQDKIDVHAYDSLVAMLEQSCQRFAERPAFSNLGTELNYRALEVQSRYFATFLQQGWGLKKGERLAIILPNLLQYPVAFFGTLRAGVVVVNVNPLYTVPELVHQLNDAGVENALILANFAHVLQEALPQTNIKRVIVTEIGDLLGTVKGTLINFFLKYVKRKVRPWQIPNTITFKQVLAQGARRILAPVDINSSDIALLQYTGGTTGVAKGAMLTHGNLVANVLQCLEYVFPKEKTTQETAIAPLPLYHIFSLTTCCLCFIPIGGLVILITDPRNLKYLIKQMIKYPFTVLMGINTLFNALLQQPKFAKLDFSKLRLAVSGGMATQAAVAENWRKLTRNTLLEGYGLTEASPVVTINPPQLTYFSGSIGLPVPATDVSVRDEQGQELPIGKSGELWVKGPQVMLGYWHNPEETRQILTEEGWLKTGDIVLMDEKGFIYLVDRKKDMIIVSGFNVYPNEVEDVIASHPGVFEVGVVGVPDSHTGEAVKAVIVKKDPALTEQDIIAYCHQRLTRYKVPKIIEFRLELPKTNVGKILRRALRDSA
ncbi:MAG: AMP-binding protein [Gammaproteobacteria bacterium]